MFGLRPSGCKVGRAPAGAGLPAAFLRDLIAQIGWLPVLVMWVTALPGLLLALMLWRLAPAFEELSAAVAANTAAVQQLVQVQLAGAVAVERERGPDNDRS